MSDLFFERVAFIGIGLIGSSLARLLRRDKLAGTIVACARRQETLDTVLRLKLADEVTDDPAAAVKDADLVVIATPLSAYAEIGKAIAPHLKPGAIVTDVGSVKERWSAISRRSLPPDVHFVPGHPVAGTENSGPESGLRRNVRGPLVHPDAGAGRRCRRARQDHAPLEIGPMKVVTMDAAHHDRVLAITSHLPHLIAYTIVGTATDLEETLQIRGDQVLRQRLPRFHPHRRVRSGDVARRVPEQPRGGARNAAALHRGSDRAAARHPLGRGRQAAGTLHPHPRDPPLDHRGEPGLKPRSRGIDVR